MDSAPPARFMEATVPHCANCDKRVTHWSLNFVLGQRTNEPCGCLFQFEDGYYRAIDTEGVQL